MATNAVWVTLLTTMSYLPATLVLDLTLREVQSRYPLVVMVTPSLPRAARETLRRRGIRIREVGTLQPDDSAKNALMEPRFQDTWNKLRAFELVEFDRVVFLDSDMLVLRNMDELMQMDLPKDWIAAAHVCACNPRRFPHYPSYWQPENCAYSSVSHPNALISPAPTYGRNLPRPFSQLNSGVVVLNPSVEISTAIRRFLATSPLIRTFHFPDQDLLSEFFKKRWMPLPWCYNALKSLRIIHQDVWRDEEVRCLHYIFREKPWQKRTAEDREGGSNNELRGWWWQKLEVLKKGMKGRDEDGWRVVYAVLARG